MTPSSIATWGPSAGSSISATATTASPCWAAHRPRESASAGGADHAEVSAGPSAANLLTEDGDDVVVWSGGRLPPSTWGAAATCSRAAQSDRERTAAGPRGRRVHRNRPAGLRRTVARRQPLCSTGETVELTNGRSSLGPVSRLQASPSGTPGRASSSHARPAHLLARWRRTRQRVGVLRRRHMARFENSGPSISPTGRPRRRRLHGFGDYVGLDGRLLLFRPIGGDDARLDVPGDFPRLASGGQASA